MWLPETAVDVPGLEQLAEAGIGFTVLAPHQAVRVRPLGGGEWAPAERALDPRRSYRCLLPSGRSIDLFFYQASVARAVAFERLLDNGERFAHRLLAAFGDGEGPQLVHIATDGETYGHHHRHGDMALAYAVHQLETRHGVPLTNYAQHLADHPPEHQVEIAENTSWSCAHGIERWRSDCGCHTGGEPGWNQRWRGPLREALDWLRDRIEPLWEAAAGELLGDPWAARDDYVEVVLDRSLDSVDRFFARHAARPLAAGERVRALELLELQRHALLMYTSCGWFFSELSGIETVQILQYAGRALQLAERRFGAGLEAGFLDRLARAESNLPARGDGRAIFERQVRPAAVGLLEVGAHYAVRSVFEEYPERARVYCYDAERDELATLRNGRARLVVGRVGIRSRITGEAARLAFGALHFGDQNLNGGVRADRGDEAFAAAAGELGAAFERGDFATVVRLLDRDFAELTYSLKSLFRDEQRKALDRILASTLADLEGEYRRIYEDHAPLMRFVDGLGIPLPEAFRAAAGLVLNLDLRSAIEGGRFDLGQMHRTLEETATWNLDLDTAGLGLALARAIDRLIERLRERPDDRELLARLERALALAERFPFEVDLWEAQNDFYRLLEESLAERARAAAAGDPEAAAWLETVRALGETLRVRVDPKS
jgi:hypothetical protein